MANKRKKFSPEEKVRLLRLHLIEKEPVSDICDRHGLNPNVFYRWQKIFFENGAAAFAQTGTGRKDSHAKKLERQNAQLIAYYHDHPLQSIVFTGVKEIPPFVDHYDNKRLHSAIGYITPKDKLEDRAETILAQRDTKLAAAREARKAQRKAS